MTEWGEYFLYVPLVSGEKIPLAEWEWSAGAPDGVDPRSEANPYALTYEQTTDPDLLSDIRNGWPDWQGRFGIIGARGDAYWSAHDFDLEGHDETFDRLDDVTFNQRRTLGVETSNGIHIHYVFTGAAVEWRERVEAHNEPGVDVLGDVPDETGIAVSPFHDDADEYEIRWAGEPLTAPPMDDLIVCADEPWFTPRTEERRDPAEIVEEFEPRTRLEQIPMWEIFPDLTEGNQAHPVHGSSTGQNFLVDEHGHSGFCFRNGHECFHTTPTLLAVHWGFIECGEWTGRGDFPDEVREKVRRKAIDEGLIEDDRALTPELVEKIRSAVGTPHELRRALRKRGVDPIDTDTVRERFRDELLDLAENGGNAVLGPPIGSGKSFTTASTDFPGDAKVVHAHGTKDETRDHFHSVSEDAGLEAGKFISWFDGCPLLTDTDQRIDEVPVAEWVQRQTGKGLSTAIVHARVIDELDIEEHSCRASTQFDGRPENANGEPSHDIFHVCDPWLHVPSLRNDAVVIIDEPPDWSVEPPSHGWKKAITLYLEKMAAKHGIDTDGIPTTYEQLITTDPDDLDADARLDLHILLNFQPDADWYLETPGSHVLAEPLARAIWNARQDDPTSTGRQSATVTHDPPTFGPGRGDTWNREHLSVVMHGDEIADVRNRPDFSQAKAVIGLDGAAYDDTWLDTDPNLTQKPLFTPDERRTWRLVEAGRTIVQVGDNQRPAGKDGKWLSERDTRERLRATRGQDIGVVVDKSNEDVVKEILRDLGYDDADERIITLGKEESNNSLAGRDVLHVLNCLDKGDEAILNDVARRDGDARPAFYAQDEPCPSCGFGPADDCDGYRCQECVGIGCDACRNTGHRRTHGRGFAGPDAEMAERAFDAFTARMTLQAAGRGGRNPDDPADQCVVYVHTNTIPDEHVDVYVETPERVTDIQATIRDQGRGTAREFADAAGCTKRHAQNVLADLEEQGVARRISGEGANGADVWRIEKSEVIGSNTSDFSISFDSPLAILADTDELPDSPPDDAEMGVASGLDPPP